MLYDLTFAQLVTLIDIKSSRELKAYEEAERRSQSPDSPFTGKPVNNVAETPKVSDLQRAFGGLMG